MAEAIDEIIDRRTKELADLFSLRIETDITIKEKMDELEYFIKRKNDDNQEGYGR